MEYVNPMKTRKNQDGQAIVEMTVGLVGMAAVLCGFILVANLTTSNIENVLSARGTADENGNMGTIGDNGDAIISWDAGNDNYQYSPDDVAMKGTSEDPNNFKGQLVVQNPDANTFNLDSSPSYIDSENSVKSLPDTSLFLSAANLIAGSNSMNVSIDEMPLVSALFLDNSSISSILLQDTLYMPYMSDF